MQVGIGYDIHRIRKGKGFYLGGVWIPCRQELIGHSDGDVLIHALCDALLGAAGAPDMGTYFPDTDEKYRGKESTWFLNQVVKKLKEENCKVVQVDSVVILETPKLIPYRESIREKLSGILEVPPQKIGIKAKTNEGLDSMGEKKSIAAWAVACLEKIKIKPRRHRDTEKA